jgi:hypothetical protein
VIADLTSESISRELVLKFPDRLSISLHSYIN